jgi:hypothetical protein
VISNRNEKETERFAALCLEEKTSDIEKVSINIYNEKKLHRILKATLCDRKECFEISIGRYIADVLVDDRIIEVQCASFYPLISKIAYYLENTDLDITVVHPIIVSKTIIRADKETGELMRSRRSSKKESAWSVLPDMRYLCDFVASPRFHLRLMMIEADEYRFSERVRYRRTGAFDKELCPRSLIGSVDFNTLSDYSCFLPDAETFDAAEYSAFSKIKGRKLYLALNFLCDAGLLEKKKEGRKNTYSKK